MFDIIKKRMTAADYAEYIKDYKALAKAKENKEKWRQAQASRKKIKEPYLKTLYNGYNYIDYKKAIKETSLKQYIEKDQYLQLFYNCGTYTGNIIESALAQELKEQGQNVKQSAFLDNVLKCDLQLNGVNYQIKNITYLQFKSKIDEYKEKNVYFIFYTMHNDNIYFITYKGKGVFSAAEVETMSQYYNFDTMTAEEYIRRLTGKEG